ncbi:hypothetical protein, partial [Epibacterium sp. Ofav1-8]|uniref:hypothetical protein n=1 Tax=Epibacterium sp. Ofav1-8 TaxID=2917735 RepID=UPI001EF5C8C2
QYVGDVIGLAGGGYVVTWRGRAGSWGGDSDDGVFGQIFDADGVRVGSDFHVNTTTSGLQNASQLVALEDGGFIAYWQSPGSNSVTTSILFQRYAADGTPVGDETVLQTATPPRESRDWQLISLEGGGVAAIWRLADTGDNEVYIQSFNLDGTPLTELTTLVEPAGTWATNFRIDLDQLSDGRLLVTWEGDGPDNIYTQTLDAPPSINDGPSDTVQEVPTFLAAFSPSSVALPEPDGGRLLVWSGGDGAGTGIWAQRYDRNGDEVGASYRLNQDVTGNQTSPEATLLASGQVAVTWMSDGDLYASVLDSSGQVIAEIPVGNHNMSQYAYEVGALADGSFVVVWSTYAYSTGTLRDVMAQRFSATGVALDAEPVMVPTSIDHYQYVGDVIGLAGGGYVVTWRSGGSNANVFGQIFDADGVRVGGDFRVNTTTSGLQNASQLVALEDGGFIAYWQSPGSNSVTTSILFQRYAADGTPVGDETVLQTATPPRESRDWQLISLEGGGVAAIWRLADTGDNEVYIQSFNLDGTPLTELTTLVEPAGTWATNFRIDLDQLSDGRLLVTWEGDGPDNIYTQTLDAPPSINEVVDAFVFQDIGTSSHAKEGASEVMATTIEGVVSSDFKTPTHIIPDEPITFELPDWDELAFI